MHRFGKRPKKHHLRLHRTPPAVACTACRCNLRLHAAQNPTPSLLVLQVCQTHINHQHHIPPVLRPKLEMETARPIEHVWCSFAPELRFPIDWETFTWSWMPTPGITSEVPHSGFEGPYLTMNLADFLSAYSGPLFQWCCCCFSYLIL